jgi:hypothetical protein
VGSKTRRRRSRRRSTFFGSRQLVGAGNSYGQVVEFEKGKTVIAVSSFDKLPSVIDTLISAIRNGELDAQLEAIQPSR